MEQPKKKSEDLSEFEVVAEFVEPEKEQEVIEDSPEEEVEDDFLDLDVTLMDGLEEEPYETDELLNQEFDNEDLSIDRVYGFSPEQTEVLKDLKEVSEELVEEPLEEIQEERIVGLTETIQEERVIKPENTDNSQDNTKYGGRKGPLYNYRTSNREATED